MGDAHANFRFVQGATALRRAAADLHFPVLAAAESADDAELLRGGVVYREAFERLRARFRELTEGSDRAVGSEPAVRGRRLALSFDEQIRHAPSLDWLHRLGVIFAEFRDAVGELEPIKVTYGPNGSVHLWLGMDPEDPDLTAKVAVTRPGVLIVHAHGIGGALPVPARRLAAAADAHRHKHKLAAAMLLACEQHDTQPVADAIRLTTWHTPYDILISPATGAVIIARVHLTADGKQQLLFAPPDGRLQRRDPGGSAPVIPPGEPPVLVLDDHQAARHQPQDFQRRGPKRPGPAEPRARGRSGPGRRPGPARPPGTHRRQALTPTPPAASQAPRTAGGTEPAGPPGGPAVTSVDRALHYQTLQEAIEEEYGPSARRRGRPQPSVATGGAFGLPRTRTRHQPPRALITVTEGPNESVRLRIGSPLDPQQVGNLVPVRPGVLLAEAHSSGGGLPASGSKLAAGVTYGKGLRQLNEAFLMACRQQGGQEFATSYRLRTWASPDHDVWVSPKTGKVFVGKATLTTDSTGQKRLRPTADGAVLCYDPDGSGPVADPGPPPVRLLTAQQVTAQEADHPATDWEPHAIGLEVEFDSFNVIIPEDVLSDPAYFYPPGTPRFASHDFRSDTDFYLVESPRKPTVGGESAPVLRLIPDTARPPTYLPEAVLNPIHSLVVERGWHDPETAFEQLADVIMRLQRATMEPEGTPLVELFPPPYIVHPRAREVRIQRLPRYWVDPGLHWTAGAPLQCEYEFLRWLVQMLRPNPYSFHAVAAQHLRDGLDFGVMVARKFQQLARLDDQSLVGAVGAPAPMLAGFLALLYSHAAAQIHYRRKTSMGKNYLLALSRDDWPGLLKALPTGLQDLLGESLWLKQLLMSLFTARNPEYVASLRADFPDGTFDLLNTPKRGELYSLGEYIDRAFLRHPQKDINPGKAFPVHTWFRGPETTGLLAATPLIRQELRGFDEFQPGNLPSLQRSYYLLQRKLRDMYEELMSPTLEPGTDPFELPAENRPAPFRTSGFDTVTTADQDRFLAGFDLIARNVTAGHWMTDNSRFGWEQGEVAPRLHIILFDRLAPGEFVAIDALTDNAKEQGFAVCAWLYTTRAKVEDNMRTGTRNPDGRWGLRVLAWARGQQIKVLGFGDLFDSEAPPERLSRAIEREYMASRDTGNRGRDGVLAAAEIVQRFGGLSIVAGVRLTGRLADVAAAAVSPGSHGLVLADMGNGERSMKVMAAAAGSAGIRALLDALRRSFDAPHMAPAEIDRINQAVDITALPPDRRALETLLGRGRIRTALNGVAETLFGPGADRSRLAAVSPQLVTFLDEHLIRVPRPVPDPGAPVVLPPGITVHVPVGGAWLAPRDVSGLAAAAEMGRPAAARHAACRHTRRRGRRAPAADHARRRRLHRFAGRRQQASAGGRAPACRRPGLGQLSRHRSAGAGGRAGRRRPRVDPGPVRQQAGIASYRADIHPGAARLGSAATRAFVAVAG